MGFDGVVALASLLCLWRAGALCDERLGWTLIGSALAGVSAGQAYLAATGTTAGMSSPADIGHLAFYPLAAAAFWHLANSRIAALRNRQLDGLAGLLTVAAVSAAVVFDRLLKTSHGSTSAVTLISLLGDMTLLGMIGALLSMAAGPPVALPVAWCSPWRVSRAVTCSLTHLASAAASVGPMRGCRSQPVCWHWHPGCAAVTRSASSAGSPAIGCSQ